MSPNTVLHIHPIDNIAVALRDLPANDRVRIDGSEVQLQQAIPAKHKFCLNDIAVGEPLMMYGVRVGTATEAIPAGGLIAVENCVHAAEHYARRVPAQPWQAPEVQQWQGTTFMGYHREDGRVGTANHWLVVPLVFCENRNIRILQASLSDALGYATDRAFSVDVRELVDGYKKGATAEQLLQAEIIHSREQQRQARPFQHVDGIKFLTHEGGCGGTRQDAEALCELLAGYITHSNVAGATVLSLGCQHAQIELLQRAIDKRAPGFARPLYLLEQQKSRSERQFIEQAVKQTFLGLIDANACQRQPAPLSKLIVGLECGGSDGFSGISANPALGHASDLLAALGATTILSEFPELHGVEQELINRCVSDAVADQFAGLMRTYGERAQAVGSGFEMNPSPGNIKDGLITDAMKSAGAARKGGSSPVTDVLDYTEPATCPGLNLLCTPGNDVESTTALAASGANVIVFTTGLGTPTGNPVAPVLKVSTNTTLYQRMRDIIDIDAGPIIAGEATLASKGEEILEAIIQTASGVFTPAAVRLGQDDFIPWKRGVSL